MKILVTGGAGYIGSVLVPLLIQDGFDVTVIDNFRYRQMSLLDLCRHPNFHIIRGDARDARLLKQVVKNSDVLLPLACLTGAPICDRDVLGAESINQDAVKALYDLKSPSQKFIFPCTNSGYGIGEDGNVCTEDSALRPISLYGRLKVDTEKYLLDKGQCVTFRLATVFGISPRMRLDLLVNDFTYRACSDRFVVLFEPHFKRNFLHVRDAALTFIHALKNYELMLGKPYNVGLSDANLSKAELCRVIQRHIPDFRYWETDVGNDPDKRNYVVGNARIEATGFRTSVTLEDGIAELIKGFQIFQQHSEFTNV